jgi:hypothetical protein
MMNVVGKRVIAGVLLSVAVFGVATIVRTHLSPEQPRGPLHLGMSEPPVSLAQKPAPLYLLDPMYMRAPDQQIPYTNAHFATYNKLTLADANGKIIFEQTSGRIDLEWGVGDVWSAVNQYKHFPVDIVDEWREWPE